MKLILMRHGEAEAFANGDFNRQLTARGREIVQQKSDLLSQQSSRIELLLSSPYIRAQQTADIVRSGLELSDPILSDAITPDRSPVEACAMFTETLDDIKTGLAVMHQPIISRLILYLTEVEQPMGTADVAVIDLELFERGCGRLICTL